MLALQQHLFAHWHQWKSGAIDWPQLLHRCHPLRLAFEATLQRVVDLGCERGERTPWAQTVRTCRQLLQRKQALWTFLETPGIEPTNNAAERALRPSVIHRKISHGVQSSSGAICRSRLLTVTATLRQQGRDVWSFLEQAWIAHRLGGVMPSLVPERGGSDHTWKDRMAPLRGAIGELLPRWGVPTPERLRGWMTGAV